MVCSIIMPTKKVIPGMLDNSCFLWTYIVTEGIPIFFGGCQASVCSGRQKPKCGCPPSLARRQIVRTGILGFTNEESSEQSLLFITSVCRKRASDAFSVFPCRKGASGTLPVLFRICLRHNEKCDILLVEDRKFLKCEAYRWKIISTGNI